MVWVDFNSESTTLDKYWVMSGEDYWGKDADGNPVMLTNYYQCDRDGNKTSGPYTSADEVPSPDGWLDVSSEIQSIKVLERGGLMVGNIVGNCLSNHWRNGYPILDSETGLRVSRLS